MPVYRIKNWNSFQHYKDRSPPWVKLHRSLLDDFRFSSLPIASKALAPMLWLLAAENMAGEVECDPEFLAFRLRWSVKDATTGINALISKGFLEAASATLADGSQPATPETETEGKTETTIGRQADRFIEFWNAYPNKVAKKLCAAKWKSKGLDAKADQILADIAKRARTDRRWLEGFIPNPQTYINQERWDDDVQGAPKSAAVPSGKPKGPSETPLENQLNWIAQQVRLGAMSDEEAVKARELATEKYRGAEA